MLDHGWVPVTASPQFAVLDVVEHRGAAEHDGILASDDGDRGRSAAFVGHMCEIDAGPLLQDFHGQVVVAAVADRSVEQSRAGLSGKLDEGGKVFDRNGLGVHRQDELIADRSDHRDHVLHHVHACRAVDVRIDDRQAVIGVKQRVAVGSGLRHDLGRDVAVRPRPIVDHDALPEADTERLANRPCDEIGRASGRITDHEMDRPRWIRLRLRDDRLAESPADAIASAEMTRCMRRFMTYPFNRDFA
jgi:hypothetical protein